MKAIRQQISPEDRDLLLELSEREGRTPPKQFSHILKFYAKHVDK